MKRHGRLLFSLIILCIVFCPSLFAASGDPNISYYLDPNSSTTKLITAYKTSATIANIPNLAVSIRLLDATEAEFQGANTELDIPDTYRGQYYGAFSWVLAGNAFENVQVTFTFGPMTLEKESTSEQKKVIPYYVKLIHKSSRVGNSSIRVNSAPSSSSYIENDFSGTTYRFKYADSLSPTSKIIVSPNPETDISSAPEINVTSNPEVTFTYNMYTNTTVTNTNGESSYTKNKKTYYYKNDYRDAVTVKAQDNDGVPVPAVCDYWNRTGTAYVKLGITSAGKLESGVKLDQGTYYATVIVEIELTT